MQVRAQLGLIFAVALGFKETGCSRCPEMISVKSAVDTHFLILVKMSGVCFFCTLIHLLLFLLCMFHTTTTTPFNHFSGSCGGCLNFAPNQAMHWVPKVSSVLGHTQKCPFVSHHCQQKWSRSPTTPALDLQHDVGAEPVDTCPGGPCWNVFFLVFFSLSYGNLCFVFHFAVFFPFFFVF